MPSDSLDAFPPVKLIYVVCVQSLSWKDGEALQISFLNSILQSTFAVASVLAESCTFCRVLWRVWTYLNHASIAVFDGSFVSRREHPSAALFSHVNHFNWDMPMKSNFKFLKLIKGAYRKFENQSFNKRFMEGMCRIDDLFDCQRISRALAVRKTVLCVSRGYRKHGYNEMLCGIAWHERHSRTSIHFAMYFTL